MKLFYFLVIIVLMVFLLTIINMMISFQMKEKHKLIEQFEKENKELNEKIEENINFQKTSMNLLKYGVKEVTDIIQRVRVSMTDDMKKYSEKKDVKEQEEKDINVVIPHDMSIVKKNKKTQILKDISKLTKEEKQLGDNFFFIKKENKGHLLKQAMKKINLKPTNDLFENYCIFRSAIGNCKLGRNDCREYCNQDYRGVLWG